MPRVVPCAVCHENLASMSHATCRAGCADAIIEAAAIQSASHAALGCGSICSARGTWIALGAPAAYPVAAHSTAEVPPRPIVGEKLLACPSTRRRSLPGRRGHTISLHMPSTNLGRRKCIRRHAPPPRTTCGAVQPRQRLLRALRMLAERTCGPLSYTTMRSRAVARARPRHLPAAWCTPRTLRKTCTAMCGSIEAPFGCLRDAIRTSLGSPARSPRLETASNSDLKHWTRVLEK